MLVAQHGKVIYEKYFEGDEETLRDARSATKTITGSLVGIAVHKKKLALDTRVWPLGEGKRGLRKTRGIPRRVSFSQRDRFHRR